MFKKDLVEAVMEQTDWCQADARRAVNAVCGVISNALQNGESVQITGFGTFGVKKYAKTSFKSIHDGKIIKLKPRKMPVFSAGKNLKADVRKKK